MLLVKTEEDAVPFYNHYVAFRTASPQYYYDNGMRAVQFGWIARESSMCRLLNHNVVASGCGLKSPFLDEGKLLMRQATAKEIKEIILEQLKLNTMRFEYCGVGIRPDTMENIRPNLDIPLPQGVWSLKSIKGEDGQDTKPSVFTSTLVVSPDACKVSICIPPSEMKILPLVEDLWRFVVREKFRNSAGHLSWYYPTASACIITIYGNQDVQFQVENKNSPVKEIREIKDLGYDHTIEYYVAELVHHNLVDKEILQNVKKFIATIPRDRLSR